MDSVANGSRFWFRRGSAPLLALLLASGVGHAAGKNDAAARAKGDVAINKHYLAMDLKAAEAELKGAIKLCRGGQCSPEVEAGLRRDLAVVYLAGKNNRQGNQEMQKAIQLHPALQLNPDLTNDEVRQAYEQAGGIELKNQNQQARQEDPGDIALEEELDVEEPSEPGEPTGHWFSGALQIDAMLHKETPRACTDGAAYFCYTEGRRYGYYDTDRPIREGEEGNLVEGGLALATVRVLLGYDYHLLPQLMVGARLGFAFNGGPVDDNVDQKSFMPLHVELRVQRLLLDDPFTTLTPYVAASTGMAQVDSGVPVEFYVDGDPTIYTLDGYRKTGKGFLALGLGTYYQATPVIAPFVELTFMQMLPISAQVFALRIGAAYGGVDL